MQVRACRLGGYVEPAKYPMVQDYASVIGSTATVAANRILRASRNANAVIRKAENTRMVYSSALLKAASLEVVAQLASKIQAL